VKAEVPPSAPDIVTYFTIILAQAVLG
jgi:hypothetical protein